jgi:hypothetical protein
MIAIPPKKRFFPRWLANLLAIVAAPLPRRSEQSSDRERDTGFRESRPAAGDYY